MRGRAAKAAYEGGKAAISKVFGRGTPAAGGSVIPTGVRETSAVVNRGLGHGDVVEPGVSVIGSGANVVGSEVNLGSRVNVVEYGSAVNYGFSGNPVMDARPTFGFIGNREGFLGSGSIGRRAYDGIGIGSFGNPHPEEQMTLIPEGYNEHMVFLPRGSYITRSFQGLVGGTYTSKTVIIPAKTYLPGPIYVPRGNPVLPRPIYVPRVNPVHTVLNLTRHSVPAEEVAKDDAEEVHKDEEVFNTLLKILVKAVKAYQKYKYRKTGFMQAQDDGLWARHYSSPGVDETIMSHEVLS